jgi:hypothetical protein
MIEAMANAWRFVENPEHRERLKEAKGIGTPATRAEIIQGHVAKSPTNRVASSGGKSPPGAARDGEGAIECPD